MHAQAAQRRRCGGGGGGSSTDGGAWRRQQRRRQQRCAPQAAAAAAPQAAAAAAAPVVVVGGGIAGLVAAGRLAQAGHRVTLLEQNRELGGRCQSLTTPRGVRFDTGPSLLLFPQVYEETFALLGGRLGNYVDARRVGPAAYRVFFADSYDAAARRPTCHLDLLADEASMARQLEREEQGAGAAYLAWLRDARAALRAGFDAFIARDWGSLAEFLDLRRLLPLLGQVSVPELLGQHHARLAARFRSPRIRALLSFQDLYVGLSPYTAPGVYSLLAATELTDGVWYPAGVQSGEKGGGGGCGGGFGAVVAGLADLARRHGAELRTDARVASVDVDGDGRVAGVTLAGSGERVAARVVVANADVPAAYRLVRDAGDGSGDGSGSSSSGGSSGGSSPPSPAVAVAQERAERLSRGGAFSAGVIAYYFSLNRRLPPPTPAPGGEQEGGGGDAGGGGCALLQHTVFLSDEYEQSWARAGSSRSSSSSSGSGSSPGAAVPLQRFPNMYVHVPTRGDPSAAPPRMDSLMVLLPAANEQELAAAAAAAAPTPAAAAASAAGGEAGNGGGDDGGDGGGDGDGRYARLVAEGRARIFATFAAAGAGVAPGDVAEEFVRAPPEWRRRYGVEHGAAFGLSHGLDQLAILRPALAAAPGGGPAGLYLCGASARPGNGVPLCMLSGRLCAERVLKDVAAGV